MNEIKNATIKSARITTSDHGLLDCWLELAYGGSLCQGFGGYALYLPKTFKRHDVMSVAGHHLFRIMEICGVSSWDKVSGCNIRVQLSDQGTVETIGHIIEDDWYTPSSDFKKALEKQTK